MVIGRKDIKALYNMFQVYEENGLFHELKKNEFKNKITGYYFKYSSGAIMNKRARISITNESNGV
jgi:hypothetical protein